MVLTQEEKMILTPTYFVFLLYTVHHDATLLPTRLECPDYQFEGSRQPAGNVSASRDKEGKLHVSLVNVHPGAPLEVEAHLAGAKATKVSGKLLTAEKITSHNTFEAPEVVKPAGFDAVQIIEGGFTATLPPKSLVVLEIE
jgi:alpha-N-arabinofuranosidase